LLLWDFLGACNAFASVLLVDFRSRIGLLVRRRDDVVGPGSNQKRGQGRLSRLPAHAPMQSRENDCEHRRVDR
jgi:hypothetical protein